MKPTATYIQGAGMVSPQSTFDREIFYEGFRTLNGNRWTCVEPDYARFIDSKSIRRMSRIIRQSNVAAQLAMTESDIVAPDSIIVGTAMGCLEDTWTFLSKMVLQQEEMLSPTAFIHSTHNSIAAQLALQFKCFGYNSTYVHRTISFENALSDAQMLLHEDNSKNVLIGGADEITDPSFELMIKLNLIKKSNSITSTNLFNDFNPGWIAGEGAAFFLLNTKPNSNSYAKIIEVCTLSGFSIKEVIEQTRHIISRLNPSTSFILSGNNGNPSEDQITKSILDNIAPAIPTFNYKKLCGEYGTSSSFALWMAAHMLKSQIVPNHSGFEKRIGSKLEFVMIYHHSSNLHHSFIMLEVC